jgi:methyltransferase (TIGR00027 family)
MMKVGQLRYIQSVYETAEYRNPDTLVRDLLPLIQRWGCDLRAMTMLARLRLQPFYYYVVARTKYYDAVFVDAICDKVAFVVNIGCGSDTRAYRFGHILKQKSIRVLECDQSGAICAKQEIARRHWAVDHVEYMSIDLNNDMWPEFEHWLTQNHGARILVLMEGVSPYVNEDAFGRFLDLLATRLQPGSRVAYDFKLRAVAEDFGRSDRTWSPFRLSNTRDEIDGYHRAHGYQTECLELSSDLSLRLIPNLEITGAPLFREDGLVRLLLPKV